MKVHAHDESPTLELFADPRNLALNPSLPKPLVELCRTPPDHPMTVHRLLRTASNELLDALADCATRVADSAELRNALASFTIWVGQSEGLTFFPATNMAPYLTKLLTLAQAERLARLGYMQVDYSQVTLQPGAGPTAIRVTGAGEDRLQQKHRRP